LPPWKGTMSKSWAEQIPHEQWRIYREVITGARARQIGFAIGGAFAVSTYTGLYRNTKDLDIYVLPEQKHEMIEVLNRLGMKDYHDSLAYDRRWIYRSYQDITIVDIIWSMANRRVEVDTGWFERSTAIQARGELIPIVPPEELIWAKLFVLQRDRCDWPDVFNIIYATGEKLDWLHLINRMGEDLPVLSAALSVYAWVSPTSASGLPEWLWERLGLPTPREDSLEHEDRYRADLIDERLWFLPRLREDQPENDTP
jgi:hypothetical protein